MQKNPSIFKHPSRSVKFCQIFFEITNICLFHYRFIFLKIQANTELFFRQKLDKLEQDSSELEVPLGRPNIL